MPCTLIFLWDATYWNLDAYVDKISKAVMMLTMQVDRSNAYK